MVILLRSSATKTDNGRRIDQCPSVKSLNREKNQKRVTRVAYLEVREELEANNEMRILAGIAAMQLTSRVLSSRRSFCAPIDTKAQCTYYILSTRAIPEPRKKLSDSNR